MPVLMIVLALLSNTGLSEEVEHWDSRLHQYAIVQATGLMPDFLQRQILKHRNEILRGCIDALEELPTIENVSSKTANEYQAILTAFKQKAKFSTICYRLGRLSCFAGEIASPLNGINTADRSAVNSFIVNRLRDFPVVVSHLDENSLAEGSLNSYLDAIKIRNQRRIIALSTALQNEQPAEWRNERSLAYGICQLIYNDMIVDTARIWLLAWQEVGGDIGTAPYFEEQSQLER